MWWSQGFQIPKTKFYTLFNYKLYKKRLKGGCQPDKKLRMIASSPPSLQITVRATLSNIQMSDIYKGYR